MMAVGWIVATAVAVPVGDGTADDRSTIEPTAEEPNAEALGAAEVERAHELAKAKQHTDAAAPQPRTGTSAALRYGSLSIAVAGLVGGGVFGIMTYRAKQDANAVYRTDPAFDVAKQRYERFAWLTLGSVGIGAVATALAVYLFTSESELPASRTVEIGVADGSFGISYSGTFAGDP